MSESLKVTHGGIEIVYNEESTRFVYELNGRERSSESLALARAAIDKPDPKEKSKFVRSKAFCGSVYGNPFEVVEVTSVAEGGYSSDSKYFWIVRGGRRQKESNHRLFAFTPENEALVAEIQSIEAEIKKLGGKKQAVGQKMKPFAPKEAQ